MFVLTVLPGDIVLPVHDGETILEAIVRDGFTYRYGCRGGGCAICKVDLVSGEIRYSKRIAGSVLSDEERRLGTCLSCRAVPVTDVVIRLRGHDHLRCVSPFGLAAAQRELARR